MSVKQPRTSPSEQRVMLVFAGALLVMCGIWLFGFALRVSLSNDNDIVARAGISRVLTAGFSDFRDTSLLLIVACGAYLACLWALNRGFRFSFPAAIAGTILAGFAMLPAMPLTSPDSVHLAADVRTFWIHHKWPASFSGTPSQVDDPVANEVRVFRGAPSGYGPLAYAIGGAPIPFVGDGFKANILGQKIMGLIFLTGTAVAAGFLAKRLGQNAALVAGIVGLNPMMTWQYPGDGHNDAMMAFFGVLALWLVMEREWPKRGAGVLTWLVSALCKYALVLASPVVAAWWWPRWRYALAGLTMGGAGFVLFLYMLRAGPIQNGSIGPAGAVIETTPWHWFELWLNTGRHGRNVMVLSSYAAYVVLVSAVMAFHPLKTKVDLVRGVALVMSVFLFVSPGYHPWYIIWMLPFAALSNARYLIAGAVAFALLAFLPVLALNWRITLSQSWSLTHSVEWFTAVMWFGTLLAVYIGWRGRASATFGSAKAKQATGPTFAPRQRKRGSARA
ncbi:MAG: hypothetical protein ABI577_02150 [bacterium]